MTPSDTLKTAWRNALITACGAASTLVLKKSDGTTLVTIALANPMGVADANGVALTDTAYAQAVADGVPATATLYNSSGVSLGVFTAGLASASPVPELPLSISSIYAGGKFRLTGSRVNF